MLLVGSLLMYAGKGVLVIVIYECVHLFLLLIPRDDIGSVLVGDYLFL
jgi:hypothetical protein